MTGSFWRLLQSTVLLTVVIVGTSVPAVALESCDELYRSLTDTQLSLIERTEESVLHWVVPIRPADSDRHPAGCVLLSFNIDANGRAENILVEASWPPKIYNRVAVRVLERFEFIKNAAEDYGLLFLELKKFK